MCGRYTLRTTGAEVAEAFGLDQAPELTPRYNIAPSQDVAAVLVPPGVGSSDERHLWMLRWGLVPHWADDASIGTRMINARSETAWEKPAFRDAFRRRRCLLPADGYFEWEKRRGGPNQPHLFEVGQGEPFALAGLWAENTKCDATPLRTCTILTTDANDLTSPVHPRMPVILPSQSYKAWLDPDFDDVAALRAMLAPYAAKAMRQREVSTKLNNPKQDNPDVLSGDNLWESQS